MAGIRLRTLIERFIAALELAGATVLDCTDHDVRPIRLVTSIDGQAQILEVFLWSVTSGGKGRNRPQERRIQLTGVDRFVLKAGVKTVLGGWSEETGVFAFWDVRRHLGFSAGSPSLQVSVETLRDAAHAGMATATRNVRAGTEMAIAIQPDYLLWYIREYERLYDCGDEIDEAARLIDATPEAEREFIDTGRDTPAMARRHQVVSIVRNFRDARFRPLVLRAYSYRCCLTGIALCLVDAAHIVPVSDPLSTDDPSNGVALIPLLHRAYDSGLLGILPGGRTKINARVLDALRKRKLGDGFEALERLVPPHMSMPGSPDLRPSDEHLRRGLHCRGWRDDEVGI